MGSVAVLGNPHALAGFLVPILQTIRELAEGVSASSSLSDSLQEPLSPTPGRTQSSMVSCWCCLARLLLPPTHTHWHEYGIYPSQDSLLSLWSPTGGKMTKYICIKELHSASSQER